MSSKHLILAISVVLATPVVLQAASQDQPPAAQAAKTPAPATPGSQQHHDEGERIFQQQCSRCHDAPEGFSPRISGTIVRHMRVRASLSKHEEEELLHFLNP
jgi:cytochrome c5